jgi:hypothetical protein
MPEDKGRYFIYEWCHLASHQHRVKLFFAAAIHGIAHQAVR